LPPVNSNGEGVGDSPADASWGYAPHEMYQSRWAQISSHLPDGEFVLVDWGSDAGWFSIVVAHSHPSAHVISVEAGVMTAGRGLALHRQKLAEYGITNNQIVNTLFGPATFESLGEFPADFQFVLSVFHHMGDGYGTYLRSVEDWDNVFCNLVSGACVTFLELPNETNPAETAHSIRQWYAGREVEQVIRAALDRRRIPATVDCLGQTSHGDKGLRALYKITLTNPPRVRTRSEIAEHIESVGRTIKERPYQRFRRVVSDALDRTIRRR
jgi:hypothetical protein